MKISLFYIIVYIVIVFLVYIGIIIYWSVKGKTYEELSKSKDDEASDIGTSIFLSIIWPLSTIVVIILSIWKLLKIITKIILNWRWIA